jgi:hypothetical protein
VGFPFWTFVSFVVQAFPEGLSVALCASIRENGHLFISSFSSTIHTSSRANHVI